MNETEGGIIGGLSMGFFPGSFLKFKKNGRIDISTGFLPTSKG